MKFRAAILLGTSVFTSACVAGPEDEFVELYTEWREHTMTFEWNANFSNWLPMNHEAATIHLEPYHRLVNGENDSLDAMLWYSRANRVMREGQGIIERMIEASRGGMFEADFNGEYWLMDGAQKWSPASRACARTLLIDVRRCYDAGDLDGAMDRLAAVYRMIGQVAGAESEIGSLSALGTYSAVLQTTELLLDAWPKGGPSVEQSAELIAAIDALDSADPFGYLGALVLTSEQVVEWAKASEDPAAELYAQWQSGPEYLEFYLVEGVVVPKTFEAFRGWMVLQWGYSQELLVYHAEQQLVAVRSLVKNWESLSEDRSEAEWSDLETHRLDPFTTHLLEMYNQDFEFIEIVWKKRGMYTDISEARELRDRLSE